MRVAGPAMVLLAVLAACGSDATVDATAPSPETGDDATATGTRASGVWLVVGDDVPARARERIGALLAEAHGGPIVVTTAETLPDTLDSAGLVVSLGATSVAGAVVPPGELAGLAPEAIVVRSAPFRGGKLLVAHGNAKAEHPHGNLGALHASYTLLEALGFSFLHPLAPVVPAGLVVPDVVATVSAPRWKERAIHLHTQHPLELTDMLQGFGPAGPGDEAGWEKSLVEWDRFLEWCVANGQNGVEWFLLWSKTWESFADSPARLGRLAILVDRAHAFGLDAGIDAPIAFAQQHAFRLLRKQGDLGEELAEIRTRLDWLMSAKLDFLGIESGTSEFTHPEPARMLAWMNEVAKHLDEKHGGTRAFVKVHCSTGQVAEGYPDPATGKPINFNMLPHHADPRLGVLPHTVQYYGLQDPAPTYGNTDFGYIRSFLKSQLGRRPTVFYPETAYWVSFDVDVPLFLPLYAERRLSDLRLLASDEAELGKKMDGQLVFSSGWEWGYWLNDVVAARAAWDPGSGSPEEALRHALAPVVKPFGSAAEDVTSWIVDVVHAEEAMLVRGEAGGGRPPPATVAMRNGQAYLQGWETWDDVSKLAAKGQMTQPDKLGLVDMRNPAHGGPGYSAEVEPLLAAMETRLGALADRGDALRARIPARARELFDDLADAMRMTALRARQVHGLYDYVDGYWDTAKDERIERLRAARKALDEAKALVATREKRYRVPAERIAGWRENPTAYEYGYLWSVRSLHYWWRDEGKAVDAPTFPCYLNVINPVDVAMGEGLGTDAARFFGEVLGSDQRRGCLAEPTSEPSYPQDGLRSRP